MRLKLVGRARGRQAQDVWNPDTEADYAYDGDNPATPEEIAMAREGASCPRCQTPLPFGEDPQVGACCRRRGCGFRY